MKKKEKYVKFCPKCRSGDIQQDRSTMQSLGYLPTKYICGNCNFSSFNFPEVEQSKVKKLNIKDVKKENKSELIDTSYGFYVKVMWRIFGYIWIVLGGIFLFYSRLLMALMSLLIGGFFTYYSFKNEENK